MNYPQNLKIWVLAPLLETGNENIDYYYDFSQSILEYTKVFHELQLNWQWQYVTCTNYSIIINEIVESCFHENIQPLFFNLCDGDDINGTPGIEVIKYLEKNQLYYTGAKEYFYHITTSKADMKKVFDEYNVPNAQWFFVESLQEINSIIEKDLNFPLIVKPAISGGSMGVGVKNVVKDKTSLINIIEEMFTGYKGWNLNAGGIIIESFIVGPEYTVFLTGNYYAPKHVHIYTPVERVFHDSLSDQEKFLSFDRLWEIYENEEPMPNEENFYNYQLPNNSIIEPLKELSWTAFEACKGTGYTRVDIRQDQKTKELFVLELNAQCGLSEDENFTSIGAILKFNNYSFTNLVKEIIDNCLSEKNAKVIDEKKTHQINLQFIHK
jgi:D-alanine-D-alanine ligase